MRDLNMKNWQPIIFDLASENDRRTLEQLKTSGAVKSQVDDYEEQVKELFQINNPPLVFDRNFDQLFTAHWQTLIKENPAEKQGRWAYFPWLATLVHILEDVEFQKVRTARNRELITAAEQEKFYDKAVGVAGMSVGSSVVLAIILQGGARHIKLADHDQMVLSNLNRIRSGIQYLGLPKVEMTARQIYEINPYAEVEIFPAGLTAENMGNFFNGLDIMIDEIDNLAVKYLIREQARRRRLPVVMAADNGDSGVVDIERYDLDPNTPFFHDRMGEVTYESLKSLDKFGIGQMIARHIGKENEPPRMRQSLDAMGKTIVSWPQLGGTALLNGSVVAYCVRKIATGEPLETNRAIISLDEKLDPNYRKK